LSSIQYSDGSNISHRFSILLRLYSTVQLEEQTVANISTDALHTSTHEGLDTVSKNHYDIYFIFWILMW